jgi:hypothetical protein
MKREIYKKKHLEEIRAEAENRRDECYNKKHRCFISEKTYFTQEDYINKYFALQ